MTRVVFMGTPEFAVPSLDALIDAGYEIVGVFTQPDRPVGRGNKLTMPPVKARALECGCPVYQFEKIKTPEGVECLKSLCPDVMVTAAFGHILTQQVLDIPTYGTVNVHASLLPKHRGSAPINHCILQGDKVTGVTIMLTDKGIDTGDMLMKIETPIGEYETAGELTERLSRVGAKLLIESLGKYLSGEIKPVQQNHAEMTYDPMLKKEMGIIDWTKSADEIINQIRGLNPWPVAYTSYMGGTLKLFGAKKSDKTTDAPCGAVVCADSKEGLFVSCGNGVIEITEMQAPNAKRMAAKTYLNGKKIEVGTVLGND